MIRVVPQDQAIKSVIENQETKGVKKNLLIGSREGKPTMALRVFELDEGGYTPFHAHPWEHINYILEGEGALKTEEGEIELKKGFTVFVPSDEKHQYKNKGKGKFSFICLVPVEKE
ncbi:cupin domain-containing protein [candidate division WOR-3 bacterium]|nr:cupin domain-containing protein [candidate division WOR-3 bacterium]